MQLCCPDQFSVQWQTLARLHLVWPAVSQPRFSMSDCPPPFPRFDRVAGERNVKGVLVCDWHPVDVRTVGLAVTSRFVFFPTKYKMRRRRRRRR